ncbi:hypothetical protein BKA83DRAFT_4128286 [Pisolithus microcarpus]|nr:hypothetical protein BKA83DRAFT_4128286 [Pisolithus microcarpus]
MLMIPAYNTFCMHFPGPSSVVSMMRSPIGASHRMKWTTAGQGGTIMQLERVGDVLAQPQQMPRQRVVLPDDAPWNVLAPTPRCQRRVTQASQKCKTRTMENCTEDLAVEMNLDSGPLPEFQMAESGSRFGFQAQTPRQPSFIGTQSLNEYEQDRTRHQVPQTTNTAVPRAQGWAVTSQTTFTTQLVSQQPRMPQDSAATEHFIHSPSQLVLPQFGLEARTIQD